jgi:hypothetical protein
MSAYVRRRTDANALTVTSEALDDFLARFEPPAGGGEQIAPQPDGP